MEMLEILTIIALTSFLNLCCFVVGAKVGQKVINKEEIKILPSPLKAFGEYKEKEEYNKVQERYRVVSENIDNYNGTPYGQQDLPS